MTSPTTRIQIKVSSDMDERITSYAKKFGITKSSFCAFLIGQGVMTFDKADSLLQKFSNGLLESDTESQNTGLKSLEGLVHGS